MNMLQYFFRKWKTKQAYAAIQRSGLFDEHYYLSTYPDVKNAGVDPLLHFIYNGAEEGRSPSTGFDLPEYLRAIAK